MVNYMNTCQEKNCYIFLDVDGVLNQESQWKHMFTLDDYCVKEFAAFAKNISEGNPRVILTSTWKNGYDNAGKHSEPVKRLINTLNEYGIKIIGKTNINDKGDRAKEINEFIKEHNLEPKKVFVIDDDKSIFKSPLLDNVAFIISNSKTGFRNKIEKSSPIEYLKRFYNKTTFTEKKPGQPN